MTERVYEPPRFLRRRPVHLACFETCDSPSGMRGTQRYAQEVIAVTKCSMKFFIASLFILRHLSVIPTSTAMSRCLCCFSSMVRLLIIDDNSTFLNAARELLLRHRSGCLVDTAQDAETALQALSRRDYDVIVTDIRLPGMQGLELLAECGRIRPATPVVMITGYGDRELEQEAARCGAYAFLHKPVAAEAFYAAVDRATLHSRSRRDRDDVSTPDQTWSINVAEAVHRKSEAITARLNRPLTSKDALRDTLNTLWTEDQAEQIIDRFIADEGPDDLLKLKDEIADALRRAYTAGQRSRFTQHRQARVDIRPDDIS